MARQFFYDYNKPAVIPDGWKLVKTGEYVGIFDEKTTAYELVPNNPPIPSARWDGQGWDVNTGRSGWKEALGEVMDIVIPGIITFATGGTLGAAVGGGMAGSVVGGAASGSTGAAMAGEDMGTGMLVGAAGGAIVGSMAGEVPTAGPEAGGLDVQNSFDTGAMAQAVGYQAPAGNSLWGTVAGAAGKLAEGVKKITTADLDALGKVGGVVGALAGMEKSAGEVSQPISSGSGAQIGNALNLQPAAKAAKPDQLPALAGLALLALLAT